MSKDGNGGSSKVGVYIDVANINMNGGYGMRYDVLRDFARRGSAEGVRLNAYSSYDHERGRREPEYRERRQRIHSALREQGYKVIEKPVKWYTDESGQSVSKANVDLDLAVDALLQSDKLDRVLLATGDGDFVQVVRALQNKGCRVEVVAFDNVSGDLRREADFFLSGYLIPNLLPLRKDLLPSPKTSKWGEAGGYARGRCHFYNHAGGFGYIRYLHTLDGDIWNVDTRAQDSPYKTAYVNRQQLPTNLELGLLPSRNVILEFLLSTKPNATDSDYLVANDVVWVNPFKGADDVGNDS